MKLIIDIDDDVYKRALVYKGEQLTSSNANDLSELITAVANGIPLPKGHGRLIDADEYKEYLYACETNGKPLYRMELDERLATVDDAPTIIEADKVESEDER